MTESEALLYFQIALAIVIGCSGYLIGYFEGWMKARRKELSDIEADRARLRQLYPGGGW